MTKYIAALHSQYPNATITTEAMVQDGYVIVLAAIMDGDRKLSSATKVYCCPKADNSVDGMEAVKDAISLTGVMVDDASELPTVSQASEKAVQEGKKADEVVPPGEPAGEAVPAEQPPAGTEEAGSPPAPQAEETGSNRKQGGGARRRSRAKKNTDKPIDPAEVEKARLVKLTFASDEAAKKAPLNMRRQEGVALGKIASEFPHFVRYLTQPAGKVYVTEDVAAAAEAIMRDMN